MEQSIVNLLHPEFAAALVVIGDLAGCASRPSDAGPSISLERSACYGRCPVYRFTLQSDRSYRWDGRGHFAVAGIVLGRMAATTYSSALKLLRDARYLDFKDSYEAGATCEDWATDGPTVTLEVTDPSGPKTIVHCLGCRGFTGQAALIELEQNLARVFRTGRFTG